MRIVVTGYAGFIGSNLTRMLMREGDVILGIDAHTYAARPEWVYEKFAEFEHGFIEAKVDLRNFRDLQAVLKAFKPDQVYHLAAESHVCRSIDGPRVFAETNFMGTFNLIEALRQNGFQGRMVHVSTDEAFGELELNDPPFYEGTPIDPRSPYAASKAASDLMVKSFAVTYGMDFVITRCTNNYGPNQHEEKLIPRTITRLLAGLPMTLHGDGTNVRDWIFVDDHCRALKTVMAHGKRAGLYCVGGGTELSNTEVVQRVGAALRCAIGWKGLIQIEYTKDRPTDDRRYAVDTEKLELLGWRPRGITMTSLEYFENRLCETVMWYAGEVVE